MPPFPLTTDDAPVPGLASAGAGVPDAGKPVDPYDINDPKVVALVKKRHEKRWKVANHRRYFFELAWLRNVLYRLAIQWIRIDWTSKTVTNLKLAPNFPRAIRNKYGKVMEDLQDAIVQGDVPLNAMPNRDNPEDVTTAQIYESLRDVIDAETGVSELKRDLAFWVTNTGNGFILPYYDYNPEDGTQDFPQYKCSNPDCMEPPTLDATQPCPCGGPPPVQPPMDAGAAAPIPADPNAPPDANAPTLDGLVPSAPPPPIIPPPYLPAGTKSLPIGRLKFRVLSPFEVYQDNTIRLGTGLRRWFFTPQRYEVDTAKALFPDFAEKIKAGGNEPMRPSRSFLTAIAYAGSYLSGTSGSGEAAAREESRDSIIAWEFRELPDTDFPQGLKSVQIGDNVVSAEKLDYSWGAGRLKGVPFLNLVHFYGDISGGAWGRSRGNDLWGIQARANVIEGNLQLTAQRTGSPKLLEPLGCGLNVVTGETGQRMVYKPLTFGGTTAAEPHYLEAALGNVQPLVLLLKELYDSMEDIAGTHFVTGAEAPSGVTAASALAFLGEKANRAISPLKEQWAEAWAQVYQFSMEIIRVHWTDDRFLTTLGRDKQWQFRKFKKADLSGAVDVRVDKEALFPKSEASTRADIMQLSQMMILDPTSPETQLAILEAFGRLNLRPSFDKAMLQAKREWDAFINDGVPPQIIPMVQNVKMHLLQHMQDATTQEFEILYRTNKPQADIWIAHIQATQLEVMAMDAPMGPASGGPPAGPGGHAGSQPGSQHGSAAGNAAGSKTPAPIRKGEAAADSSAASPLPATPIGNPQPH